MIDKIDLDILSGQYKTGGTSSYHPKMLNEDIVLRLPANLYSSRKQKAAIRSKAAFGA